ncbi:hypothetical protein FNO01nite_05720 [Flavobacterium noncentrifugens]|uniref:50S ribosomal protein L27 n=1 Tax=Flavobacterium noncentrifugens TaxID=1128970 RepID=A0A1G8SN26_9FLAO|nr:hypothetical protein [Flavobacterium noncentrifugens]GEP49900.1 hypothetical protein FNO01nite_05720 [Flavobacterium noncentrifugens]SDJ30601.1 hypothetical protein SAMN04487935_0628 [Flavobacterium noncentrifugens]
MYEFILKAHSGWAYVVLLTLIITVINSLVGISSKEPFGPKDRRIALFGLITTHVQFLIAMILYFTSPLGFSKIRELGMGTVMKNPELRLTVIEHPFINLIAIVLITIGWSTHKRATESPAKFKKIAIFYALGLLLILSRIPWSHWI